MIKLTKLALKNGAIVMDELMPSQTEILFNTAQLQAFADEYLALSSSEPVTWMVEDGIELALFRANPVNQQLLLERNECVEEIKRLREVFEEIKHKADINGDYYLVEDVEKALSTTDSIKKLIE